MEKSVVIIMVLLSVGFLSTRLAQWVRLPHSVFLVLLGVLSGLWLRHEMPHEINNLAHMFPEIILFVLLPPLIFESAYNLRFSELKKDWIPISLLAVCGLCLSTFIVGIGLHYLLDIKLTYALVFGALISATDPVAVVALFKEVGAPKRLNTLVEGESLLNDGTAIVLFRVLLAIAAAPAFEPQMITNGLISFLIVSFGGIAIGIVSAWTTSFFLRITSDSAAAQLGLTVSSAYLCFIMADHYFHVSGVIATMTLGLYLGTFARLKFNKESLSGMHYIWESLALACNTIVFFAVGASLDLIVMRDNWPILSVTIVLTYLARIISITGLVPFNNLLPRAKPVDFSYQAILIWGGLRGGLAVGLVLMLPESIDLKPLFITMVMAVVFTSLFVNALSVSWLMNKLGLTSLNKVEKDFFERTMDGIRARIFLPVKEAASTGSLSVALVEREEEWLNRDSIIDPNNEKRNSREFETRLVLLHIKNYYDQALKDKILSKAGYIQLVDQVTVVLELISDRGVAFSLNAPTPEPPKTTLLERVFHWGLFEKTRVQKLADQLEILLHRVFGYSKARTLVTDPEIKSAFDRWISDTKKTLNQFYLSNPIEGTAMQSFFIHNALAAYSERELEEFFDLGLINSGVFSKAKEEVHRTYSLAITRASQLLKSDPRALLKGIHLFSKIPENKFEAILAIAKPRIFQAFDQIVKEDDTGNSFYLVISGILEVTSAALEKKGIAPKLFSGDFFGEYSLLYGRPRSASVSALTKSELWEIPKESFDKLLEDHPEIKNEIFDTAERRAKKSNTDEAKESIEAA